MDKLELVKHGLRRNGQLLAKGKAKCYQNGKPEYVWYTFNGLDRYWMDRYGDVSIEKQVTMHIGTWRWEILYGMELIKENIDKISTMLESFREEQLCD